jgi:hypothetical protein
MDYAFTSCLILRMQICHMRVCLLNWSVGGGVVSDTLFIGVGTENFSCFEDYWSVTARPSVKNEVYLNSINILPHRKHNACPLQTRDC